MEMESVINVLDLAMEDYLQWMVENGYAKSTRKEYSRGLSWFKLFIKNETVCGMKSLLKRCYGNLKTQKDRTPYMP